MAKADKVMVSGVPTQLVEQYAQLEREIKALTEAKAQLRKVLLTYVPAVLADQPVGLILPGYNYQVLLSKPVDEVDFIEDFSMVKTIIQSHLGEEMFVRLARFSLSDLRTVMKEEILDEITTTVKKAVRKFLIQPKG